MCTLTRLYSASVVVTGAVPLVDDSVAAPSTSPSDTVVDVVDVVWRGGAAGVAGSVVGVVWVAFVGQALTVVAWFSPVTSMTCLAGEVDATLVARAVVLETGAVEVFSADVAAELSTDVVELGAGFDVVVFADTVAEVVSEDTVAEVVGTAVTWDVDVNVDG